MMYDLLNEGENQSRKDGKPAGKSQIPPKAANRRCLVWPAYSFSDHGARGPGKYHLFYRSKAAWYEAHDDYPKFDTFETDRGK